jgi:hypothetical protein
LQEVWGITHVEDAHYPRIFIRRVRKKIRRTRSVGAVVGLLALQLAIAER